MYLKDRRTGAGQRVESGVTVPCAPVGTGSRSWTANVQAAWHDLVSNLCCLSRCMSSGSVAIEGTSASGHQVQLCRKWIMECGPCSGHQRRQLALRDNHRAHLATIYAPPIPRPENCTCGLTLRATPSCSTVVSASFIPRSLLMYSAPVTMAMSCSRALRRSPKPGALMAHTLTMPLSLLTTRVASASPADGMCACQL